MGETTQNALWSTAWHFAIDPDNFKIFPLQFANCQRIEYHDAVYLFDEVGCGKTISAGLMALHYLYNHPNKKVLVITTNTLVENGQFLRDWKEKLPFGMMIKRVTLCNNLVTGIENHARKEYGLLVIDEAHEFLNRDQKRSQELIQIKAEKVVFLTATPIKSGGKGDLKRYVEIAQEIVGHPVAGDWIDELVPEEIKVEPRHLICSRFALHLPLTRYFKDTVRALMTGKLDEGLKARRLLADTWEYEGDDRTEEGRKSKIEKLFEQIKAIRGESEQNRFVVFAHFEKEIDKIRNYFLANGYEGFRPGTGTTATIQTLMGPEKWRLQEFSSEAPHKLPTVLVLNYQIGESGVNLPGYNHIVNYNISAFPSRLEQRFGRIDRMDSKFDEINVHYLVSSRIYGDCNTANFSSAVASYTKDLLACLPSKNALLSKKLIEQQQERIEASREQMEKNADSITRLIKDSDELIRILKWMIKLPTDSRVLPTWYTLRELLYNNREQIDTERLGIQLFRLNKQGNNGQQPPHGPAIEENDLASLSEETLDKLRHEIEEALNRQRNRVRITEKELDQGKKIAELGDKIFFSEKIGKTEKLLTVDTIYTHSDEGNEGCAVWISESDAYKDYQELFQRKFPLFFQT